MRLSLSNTEPMNIPARTIIVAALGLLLQLPAYAAESPASTVTGFYRKHIELKLSGAPSPKQLQAIAPYLSQHLQALLERAWQQHERDIKRAPDEKPAFAEGDLFTSLFEGPTSFAVIRTETLAHEYAVTVQFTYQAEGQQTVWKDVVRVASKQGKPVIVNVEYGGDWPFAAKGSLITTLEEGGAT